ncbi:flagellar basal body rod protein FlgF [Psychromonas antarctica]|jgi:flagellar basal-body rod protein FlgF|uniref:flagellar basal body rod protein FlgF n=1 Tax=Psychromonas antarctica TaxID=67573 RepID=UPI001EE8257C|nr:flagellar basal body rod protein FlgF [Psychromonas antarctica]MCG6199772.1 flagellar basal body rod protein FlgF [Psychromonas antarctica]
MDRFLYISMSGAKESMNALAIHGNNLANASKTGFKSSFEQARSMQAYGEGLPTRVFSLTEEPGQNFESGILQTTGRDLDVAIEGDGWLVVDSQLGGEAMTRSGGLNINQQGFLVDTQGNQLVDRQGNPVFIPLPVEKFSIRKDGVVEIRPEGAPADAMEEVAQLKLVNPSMKGLMRGQDGLFRRIDGVEPEFDEQVSLQSGTLEASNVNLSSELTSLINLQRQFEMQIKMMSKAEEMDKASESLLRVV